MPLLMLKDLPRYECLLAAAERYPSLQPSACDAFLNLLRAGDTVFDAEGRFLSQHGISQSRFTVLMLLHHCCGPSTPAELAEETGVTRATMTGLIDTLEKDGWAQREMDPHDRRTTRVRLTPAGESFLERTLPDYFRCVSSLMDPLDEAERQQLVTLLQKIQRALPEKRPAAPALAEVNS